MDVYDKLSETLKISFSNKILIKQAFIHRSYLNESKKRLEPNERLEFLGDSILSFIVSQYLYLKYPKFREGELTNLRSSIVKTSTLASIAKQLHLGDYLMLSRGEEDSGGRNNPSILADTFEALLGAIYLDSGLNSIKIITSATLFVILPKILESKSYKDAKSNFQELVQDETKVSPLYKVLGEKGPDHAKQFNVGVYVNSTLWGIGKGKNKHEAEQVAALEAIEKWRKK